MMKLYYASSVCSLAVRITLYELKIPCDFESVNLKTKQTERGENYLDINPKGSVPALMLNNNELLTENAVILQYLADTYKATALLSPVGEIKRYRILEWLNYVSTDLHRFCAPLFWAKFSEETKATVFIPILSSKLDIVDNRLKINKFLMGDHITLADNYLLVILTWLAKLQISMEKWPNLVRYFADMKQIDSVQQSLKDEGIDNLSLKLK